MIRMQDCDQFEMFYQDVAKSYSRYNTVLIRSDFYKTVETGMRGIEKYWDGKEVFGLEVLEVDQFKFPDYMFINLKEGIK